MFGGDYPTGHHLAGTVGVLIVWVDDMLIVGSGSQIDHHKEALRKRFTIKDLGAVQHFLGMKIERNRADRQIELHQSVYIESVLQRFRMAESNPLSTPMERTVLQK